MWPGQLRIRTLSFSSKFTEPGRLCSELLGLASQPSTLKAVCVLRNVFAFEHMWCIKHVRIIQFCGAKSRPWIWPPSCNSDEVSTMSV